MWFEFAGIYTRFAGSKCWPRLHALAPAKSYSTLTVHCIAVVVSWCVSFNKRRRITCLLPSLTTVHYYFVLILHITATMELLDDGRLVVGEYTKRRFWASQHYAHPVWNRLANEFLEHIFPSHCKILQKWVPKCFHHASLFTYFVKYWEMNGNVYSRSPYDHSTGT